MAYRSRKQQDEEMVIEYPSSGATYYREEYGVYRYGTYERSSVLAGQQKRSFVDSFETLAEAQENYPQARWDGGGSQAVPVYIPEQAPDWFDPADAGESWDGDY
jgi:hypothetical protein